MMSDVNDKVDAEDNDEEGEQEEDAEEPEAEENVEEYSEEEALSFVHAVRDKESDLQAPIDLNISTMSRIRLSPLAWYNHDVPPKKIKITNTGRTVIYSAKWQRERPYLVDGPFHGKYVFSQYHFHWGENEMLGSEHYVDGCCMPMELHAVHFNADYQSQDEALRYPDGLAILVYLLALQSSPNPALTSVLAAFPSISEAGSSTRLAERQPIVNLLRPFDADYFLYHGCLSEGTKATWIVSREPIGVAQEQIAQFRTLRDKQREPILDNRAELREREGRRVFHVNPSGRANSSLLWIPRGPLPLTANQLAELAMEKLAVAGERD